jgi:hypothetical protein
MLFSRLYRYMARTKIKKVHTKPVKVVAPDKNMYYAMYYGNSDIQACVNEISKRAGVNAMYWVRKGKEIDSRYLDTVKSIFSKDIYKKKIVRDILIGGEVYIVPEMNSA